MFRLHKVLDWKRVLEMHARAERLDFEQRLRDLEGQLERLAQARYSLPDTLPDSPDAVAELAQWACYSEGIRRREDHVGSRLADFRPRVEEKVSAHVELRKEVKGLERLEARYLAQRKKDRERMAQYTMDEAAARRSFPDSGSIFRDQGDAGVSQGSETGLQKESR